MPANRYFGAARPIDHIDCRIGVRLRFVEELCEDLCSRARASLRSVSFGIVFIAALARRVSMNGEM
jgi:hypothetical protein